MTSDAQGRTSGAKGAGLSLMAGSPPPALPLGRPLSARQIVTEFGTDDVTGEVHFSEKWVRETVPHKVRASHSTVFWYYPDVVAFFEAKRKVG